MKRFCSKLLISALSLSLLAGCAQKGGTSADSTGAGSAAQGNKLSVYASFYPMYDFATKIGGEHVDVVSMVPAGTEPHDWEPTAADIAGLEAASVFVYNGAGLEHWTGDVLKSLENDALVAVEASTGVTLMEGHHHDEEEAHEDEALDADEHEDEAMDPHVWLSPVNVKLEMRNIADGLIKADPENRDDYEANYAKYAAELDTLDKEFRETLTALPKNEIIVSHEAFGYLCKEYGLTQVGIEGLTPDSEPDPARMAEVITFAKEHDVSVIFFETLVNPKVAETIADATGAKTAVLSPIEGLSDEQQAAGDDYFDVMRQNLAALKAALQ